MNTKNQLVAIGVACMIVMNVAVADSSLVQSMTTFQPNQDSRFIALDNDGTPINITNGVLDFPPICTQDKTTGLVWEVKTEDFGLRDKNWTYTWYNHDVGMSRGNFANLGSITCGGTLPNNQCNTQAYVTVVNAAGLCGANDWRLPTLEELQSLTQTSTNTTQSPTIDFSYFPNTQPHAYWTATTEKSDPARAWSIDFNQGLSSANIKTDPYSVRLVRGNKNENENENENEDGLYLLSSDARYGLAANLPDLVVTAVTAGSSAQVGGKLKVSAVVKNQGKATAGASRLNFYFNNSQSNTNIKWQTYTGSIPNKAVKGGQESNGSPLYICRASYKNGIHPGKVAGKNCNIGWGGSEQVLRNFELLVNEGNSNSMRWQTYTGSIPNGAVKGGQESNGSPLYICRASYKNGIHPGKVVGKNCNIGWGGSEQVLRNFEVLIMTVSTMSANTLNNAAAQSSTRTSFGCNMPKLSAGDTKTCSGDIVIPSNTVPGITFLGAIADDYKAVSESNEENNENRASNPTTIRGSGGGGGGGNVTNSQKIEHDVPTRKCGIMTGETSESSAMYWAKVRCENGLSDKCKSMCPKDVNWVTDKKSFADGTISCIIRQTKWWSSAARCSAICHCRPK